MLQLTRKQRKRQRKKPNRNVRKRGEKGIRAQERNFTQRRINDKDIFYGRGFEGEETKISEIYDEIGEVVIKGQIFSVDTREIRNEKTIVMFNVTDFTDSISVKLFVKNEVLADVLFKY